MRLGEKNSRWKGGKYKTRAGYVLILKKSHPNTIAHGYIFEHRLMVEKSIGRYLKRGEVVHHKNGIKDDNRLSNLELLPSQVAHYRKHTHPRKNPNNTATQKQCHHCKEIKPLNRTYFHKRKASKDGFAYRCIPCAVIINKRRSIK